MVRNGTGLSKVALDCPCYFCTERKPLNFPVFLPSYSQNAVLKVYVSCLQVSNFSKSKSVNGHQKHHRAMTYVQWPCSTQGRNHSSNDSPARSLRSDGIFRTTECRHDSGKAWTYPPSHFG